MDNIHRYFLVIEGQRDGYPNYQSARVHFSEIDPCCLSLDNLFICSPLFSVLPSGYQIPPQLSDSTLITFVMAPNVFPTWDQIIKEINPSYELWFSLGLANLVIIENQDSAGITEKVLLSLRQEQNITAYETWKVVDGKISNEGERVTVIEHSDTKVEKFDLRLSEKLPLHIKFGVSEYIISINKFLTASKKFTPHYYPQHYKTIDASKDVINDLSFLFGDDAFEPTQALINSLSAKSQDEAREFLISPHGRKRKEDLINDRNSRLIQFNSSMSYVYSQAYSGTFPIFDHIGIIRRHSLLGIGSAIGALFELVSQIEEALFYLPFEKIDYPIYAANIPDASYFDLLEEPSQHNVDLWKNDSVRAVLSKTLDPAQSSSTLPVDFFNRLSFFSGRLGFREYDLSATAAIQVLTEGNSLQWHVINYTHEIIHNHVRLILHNLVTPPLSLRNSDDDAFISRFSQKLIVAYRKNSKETFSYFEYFILLLFNFSINSINHGSLTRESNYRGVIRKMTEQDKFKYKIPVPKELRILLLAVYKDISEIFVHAIDFTYIYKRNVDIYIQSIWASWSTVTSVAFDLKQYILRTLLIISLSEDGKTSVRYELCKKKFLSLLDQIAERNDHAFLFSRIKEILNDKNEIDLQVRFNNCLVISDMVGHFFIGKLETTLDGDDRNLLPAGITTDEENTITYNIETNTFEGDNIKSKVRFLLDQLLRTTYFNEETFPDAEKEKTSAWLLLSLSSYNKP